MRFRFFFWKRGRYTASDRLSLINYLSPSFLRRFLLSAVMQFIKRAADDARIQRLNQAATHFREVNQVARNSTVVL